MHGSLLAAGLVDKIIAFVAPKVVGGDADKSPIMGWGLPSMNQALTLEDTRIHTFQEDVCIEGYVSDAFRDLNPLTTSSTYVARRGAKVRQSKHDSDDYL